MPVRCGSCGVGQVCMETEVIVACHVIRPSVDQSGEDADS
jgi:hypothetical protein